MLGPGKDKQGQGGGQASDITADSGGCWWVEQLQELRGCGLVGLCWLHPCAGKALVFSLSLCLLHIKPGFCFSGGLNIIALDHNLLFLQRTLRNVGLFGCRKLTNKIAILMSMSPLS